MAACEFCLQDGGVSEGFTHKMAAWEICLQDGGVSESLKYILCLQCRIYLVNVTWPVVIIPVDRETVNIRNAERHVAKQLVVGHATIYLVRRAISSKPAAAACEW